MATPARVSPLTVPSTCMTVQKQRETGGMHLEDCPTASARLRAQGPRPRLCLGEHLLPRRGGLHLAPSSADLPTLPLAPRSRAPRPGWAPGPPPTPRFAPSSVTPVAGCARTRGRGEWRRGVQPAGRRWPRRGACSGTRPFPAPGVRSRVGLPSSPGCQCLGEDRSFLFPGRSRGVRIAGAPPRFPCAFWPPTAPTARAGPPGFSSSAEGETPEGTPALGGAPGDPAGGRGEGCAARSRRCGQGSAARAATAEGPGTRRRRPGTRPTGSARHRPAARPGQRAHPTPRRDLRPAAPAPPLGSGRRRPCLLHPGPAPLQVEPPQRCRAPTGRNPGARDQSRAPGPGGARRREDPEARPAWACLGLFRAGLLPSGTARSRAF